MISNENNFKIGYDTDAFKLELISENKMTVDSPPFRHLEIASSAAIKNIISENYPHENYEDRYEIFDPNGYKFILRPNSAEYLNNSITEVYSTLNKLETSFSINLIWSNIVKLKISEAIDGIIPENELTLRCKLPITLSNQKVYNKIVNLHVFDCELSEIMPVEMTDLDKYYMLKLSQVIVYVIRNQEEHEVLFFEIEDLVDFKNNLMRKKSVNFSRKDFRASQNKKCCLS